MARALTGPRVQDRLLTTLGSRPGVWTNDHLCKALVMESGLHQAALLEPMIAFRHG